MIKHLSVRRSALILLLILFAGIISFSQAIQIPLEQAPAERVLAARNILYGNLPLTGWRFHPLELPVYLLSVLIFRLSTFAAIAASECFYMILFCSGLLILSGHRMLTPVSCLIWLALAGIPDQPLVRNVQNNPMLFIGLLYFLYFLSKLTEQTIHGSAKECTASPKEAVRDPEHQHHSVKIVLAGLVISLAVLLPAAVSPGNGSAGLHETLRTLQRVFRADFSKQPLLQFMTIRYFVNTVILLLILFVLCHTIAVCICRRRMILPQVIYSAAVLFTIIFGSYFCSLPEEELLCSLIIFVGGILLSSAYESSSLKRSRFMAYRIPFPAAAAVFFIAAIFLRIEPVVTSRPQSAADKTAAFLQENALLQGYCAPEDLAVLTTASKGKVQFTDNAGDPDNRFSVFREETKPENTGGEIFKADPYLIVTDP